MQRLNIQVDLENNEILEKEIQDAIAGVVKAKTREAFHAEIESEIKRIAVAEFERLNKKGGYYGDKDSLIEKKVKELIDQEIIKALGEITVSQSDIQQRIDEKIKNVAASIDYAVSRRVERLDIKNYIKDEVADSVRRLYPQEILKLIEQKEIEDLKKRIKELELENEKLKKEEGSL